jgi:RNA polymerase sigma-70 factor (ECF subfamily)
MGHLGRQSRQMETRDRRRPVAERNNEQWLHDLREPGPEQEQALGDLRTLLVRGLGYALSKYRNVTAADLQDFAQDATLKILDALDSFRGESRFSTWATKIAVHTAFTELRRRRWKDVSLEAITTSPDDQDSPAYFIPSTLADPSIGSEQQAMQNQVLDVMRRVISTELTERQRQALVAARLRGVSLEEVARQMGTNRNALYKLLFDARQKLKEGMLAQGLSPEDILSAFGL